MSEVCFTLPRGQRGAALVFAFIFLVALGLIGVASVGTSVMELHMASNAEEEMNAFQTAQSAIDFLASNPSVLPSGGPLNTPTDVPLPTTSPSVFQLSTGETIRSLGSACAATTPCGQATRVVQCAPPPRASGGSSLLSFSAFSYRLSSDVNKTATGKGQAALRQGHILLGPKC